MTEAKPKALVYARVSTSEQARKDLSIPAQTEDVTRFAEGLGYEVVGVYADPGYSGEEWDRPGLGSLRRRVAEGGVDAVLVRDRDRIGRDGGVLAGLLRREFDPFGTQIRAKEAKGDGSTEGELLDGILDQYARFQLQKTRELTRRGKLRRAQRGQVPPGRFVPFGYYYDREAGTYRVDEGQMPYVGRIFREVGSEERSLTSVAKAFEREGIPTPGGGKHWYTSSVRDIVRNDIYLARTPEEVRLLAARGFLTGEVLSRLDLGPEARHSVYWFNRSRVKRVYTGGKKLLVTPNEEDSWVAVPVEAAPVARGWVEAARNRIAGRTKDSWAGGQRKELSGGVARCSECGSAMTVFTAKRKGTRTFYYVCGSYRRHRGGECGAGRYHRAESLEGQVRRFVLELVRNPEVLREKIQQQEAQEGEDLSRAESEARDLAGIMAEADEERDGYIRLSAKGRISEEELDRYLAEIDERKATAQGRLDVLLARLQGGGILRADSMALMEEYLSDLPRLLDSIPPLRDYETIPEERTEENPLGIYKLAPERIHYLSEEEMAERRRAAEGERAARFRWAYEMLGLGVRVCPDGRLEIAWAAQGARCTTEDGSTSVLARRAGRTTLRARR